MKRTYKFTEIAGKIGKPRAAVVEWSNYFREFLPTKAIGGSLRYTEEAIEIFEIIAKLSDANKPLRSIKEHLREMPQRVVHALQDEKPLSLTPAIVPDSILSPSADPSISPSVLSNPNFQLSKETKEVSHMVQLLTQKMGANKSPMDGMERVDDLNQKVGISSLTSGRLLSPMRDQSNAQFDQLSIEVAALSNMIETLKSKLIEISGLSEEVTELRNLIQILTHHITNLFEQDTRNEVAATLVFLHREIEFVAVEVKGLNNVIETVQQKVAEDSERDLQGEILASTKELLNERYESITVEVQNLYKGNQFHTQKVIELQNVIETVQQKVAAVAEISERDLRGEILASTKELLNQRYESIMVEVQNLHKGNQFHTQKVIELQNVIETVQQKVAEVEEVAERDLRGEILASTKELLNQRYESISAEVQNLRKGNQFQTQKVTELQNVIETVQQKVVEVSEVAERDLRGEILAASTELVNQRYDEISQQVTSQQRLLDKIAKILGF
ncbi:hypothetical protein GCM10008018_50270 [Paenibacillus marchantiophytorum]|uniref:MerR family transcriptional regulator n=1 Tax=Paenibacillus marchantiophytorum TaxID=1619310 RepID=A0ABQ1F2F5_9BACL|nr:hypothetical protein [Paenibacillus marchantiophytorum]GFZ97941.1 hypothetical protein GCM10008018_50270 [Paenibacillus marchantiophytorum]